MTRFASSGEPALEDPLNYPTLVSGVFYRDPFAALDWLETAFGFRKSVLIRGSDGELVHAEMRFADACIIVDGEWSDHVASPASLNGRNTQSVYLRITREIDAHCEAARRAGATIVQEPEDQFYGDRTYRARDPEGHVWTFSQTIGRVSREEVERVGQE